MTNHHWKLNSEEVVFADTLAIPNSDGNYHVNELYHQRFLPKTIYESADYTMLVVDTRTDGNKFLTTIKG